MFIVPQKIDDMSLFVLQLYDRINTKSLSPSRPPPSDTVQKAKEVCTTYTCKCIVIPEMHSKYISENSVQILQEVGTNSFLASPTLNGKQIFFTFNSFSCYFPYPPCFCYTPVMFALAIPSLHVQAVRVAGYDVDLG